VRDERPTCETAHELLEIYQSIAAAFEDYSGDELVRAALVRSRGKYVKHIQMHGCQTGERPFQGTKISLPLSLPECRGLLTVTFR
jgi:hypothetical protein